MGGFNDTAIAKRLKAARTKRGLSVREIAKHTGLSADAIRRFERGDAIPNLGKLGLLLQAIGATPDEILCEFIDVDKPMLEDELYLALKELKSELESGQASELRENLGFVADYLDGKGG